MRPGTTHWLLGANLALALLLAWLWVTPQGGLRNVHWEAPRPVRPDFGVLAPQSAPLGDADISRYMVILDRPLFSPSRRPPPPPKAAVRAPDPLDSIQVIGMFTGTESAGILARVDGRSRRLRVGEALGEWTLREIRAREAVFNRGGESRSVPLLVAKQAATALPPAVAAPAPPPAAPVVSAVPAPTAPAAAAAPAAAGASAPKSPFAIGGSVR